MKKRLFFAALAALLMLGGLPLEASAEEGAAEPLAAVLEELGEKADSLPALEPEEDPPYIDGPDDMSDPEGGPDPAAPAEGEETPEDPDADPEGPEDGPEEPGEGPVSLPELETEDHISYIGGSDDLVKPEGKLTRAEAAKIICTLLKEDSVPAPQEQVTFPDVPSTAWFAPYVEKLAGLGIFQGLPDGDFGPSNPITRAQFVQVLARFYEPEGSSEDFSDVPAGHWAYQAVSTAVAKGWTNGYGDGCFRPNRQITRAEAITIMNRVLGRSADKAKLSAAGNALVFLDLPFTHWAYYDVMEASLPHVPAANDAGESWKSYTVPRSERGTGPRYYNNETYYVTNDGHYARGTTIGSLRFRSDGRYTSGDDELDAAVSSIFRSQCKSTNTPEQNLRCMFDYVYAHTRYRGGEYIADGATGWTIRKAKETIRVGYKGNCYNYAALMTVLAQRTGLDATAYSGAAKFTFQSYWAKHAWCEVTIDGKKYICDPELEANFVKNRRLGWKLYKVAYADLPYKLRCNGVVFQ